MTRAAAKTIIGPADNGRRMSLDEFDTAEGQEGRLYELSRGVIIVTDVPNPPHGRRARKIRLLVDIYSVNFPGVVHEVYTGAECKLLIQPTQSERHPDVAIYMTPAPADDSTVWSIWVPEIVVEIVSPDSGDRDYNEKAEDYLLFGVKEYWIFDPLKNLATFHRRMRGQWKLQTLAPGEKYSTPLLPSFVLEVADILSP